MAKAIRVIADIVTLGLLPVIRWLLRKANRKHIAIDLNHDGNTDIEIHFPGHKDE